MTTGGRQSPLYLDHHATTPVDRDVLAEMLPYFADQFGNAASIDHSFGIEAERAVDGARRAVASLIGAQPGEIVFTSGATEANNLALFGAGGDIPSRHVIVACTEHRAVLDPAIRLAQLGADVTYLDVDPTGLVDPDDIRRAIRSNTVLISVMAANNEIGTMQPLAAIGEVAAQHGVLFHTDATQAVGHVPIDVQRLNIDLLSLSAHKFYGPKGIGALYVRRRGRLVKLIPTLWGGGHERGLRSGTLNVPAIVGLGAAAAKARALLPSEAGRVRAIAQQMLTELTASVDGLQLNGHPTERLPHNLNLYVPGVQAKTLVMRLPDIAFSTGAACSSAHVEPSHVLAALGLGEDRPFSSIRLGLGRSTTRDDAAYAVERLTDVIGSIRRFAASQLAAR